MACMQLGTKPEAFQLQGHTWQCTSGPQSDVTIEIGEMSFHLHKFPLLSRSGLLGKLIDDVEDDSVSVLHLNDLPGGAKVFELVSKFCYGIKIEITALNVVSLRCAAEYLQMTEDYGEGNLIKESEAFLNEVFNNWTDTIKALETCEEVLSDAEELDIVSRCIDSLAKKVCSSPSLYNWPVAEPKNDDENTTNSIVWNGISTSSKPQPMGDDWWYGDVSFLGLSLYKRLIQSVESGGMKPETIAGSLVVYAKKYIPLMNRQSSFNDGNNSKSSTPSEADQRALLEEIVELLPSQKGIVPTKFLIRLLRTAMVLQASPSCRENLEKRVGAQLDQATLDDLLIPNMGYSVETLYDIDCFQRILDNFMSMDRTSSAVNSPYIVEEEIEGGPSLTSLTLVANLVDAFLADVAPDVNLKFPKFLSLASAIPDYARPLSDSIYRAIDIFLKAHPWLTDSEREQICRLMNCQKLSLEASTHAGQNERLPLRVIVQVLFFEQLRLRTSISGWFFVENSQNPNSNNLTLSNVHDICAETRDRVLELEKECQGMKDDIHKLVNTKRGWNFFWKRRSKHSKSQK